ncbi:MAG TPA: cupin domain-containing protein [Candidatus Obscuribacterales bacterium]
MVRKARVLSGAFADVKSISELRRRLKDEGYSIFEWQDGPGAYYSPHSHPHDEFIVVASGNIVFTIDGLDYELSAGDGFDLPAGAVHEAVNKGSQAVKYMICTRQLSD